jgi:hypothetical protein
MKIDAKLAEQIASEVKALKEYRKKVMEETRHVLGESCAPDADLSSQCKVPAAAAEFYKRMVDRSAALDALIFQGLRQVEDPADANLKVPRAKTWVRGGPTPYWLGSLADDTLLQSADFFGSPNVVYVGGPVNEKFLAPLSRFDKVMVQMTEQCRAPEFQPESDGECAEKLSRLSLKYPNIVAGILDDATRTGHNNDDGLLKPSIFRPISENARKHNTAIQVAVVVYTFELYGKYDFSQVVPFFDKIVLWFWNKQELVDFDAHVKRCQEVFPGKEIMMGIFIHDYGCADLGNPPECIRFQMHKAARLIKDGTISGIVILGDREIRKWPVSTQAVLDCLE